MKHSEFSIGCEFTIIRMELERNVTQRWRCTDVGTRTIAAIQISHIDITETLSSFDGERQIVKRSLNQAEAEADGWFNGPPYAVVEHLFDEHEIPLCTPVDDR